MKTRRPYRLEIDGAFGAVTFTTEQAARVAKDALRVGARTQNGYSGSVNNSTIRPGLAWRITLRADKGRKTTLIAEVTF